MLNDATTPLTQFAGGRRETQFGEDARGKEESEREEKKATGQRLTHTGSGVITHHTAVIASQARVSALAVSGRAVAYTVA